MNELVNTREAFMFVNVDNVSFQMEKMEITLINQRLYR